MFWCKLRANTIINNFKLTLNIYLPFLPSNRLLKIQITNHNFDVYVLITLPQLASAYCSRFIYPQHWLAPTQRHNVIYTNFDIPRIIAIVWLWEKSSPPSFKADPPVRWKASKEQRCRLLPQKLNRSSNKFRDDTKSTRQSGETRNNREWRH